MRRKYYEYYEDIYGAALAADAERYNNPLEGHFDDLFERSLLPEGGRVLDMGCGEGLFALLFAAEGYEVVGVDISASAVAWAQQRAAAQGLTNAQFHVGDVTSLEDFAEGSFDVVLSVHCYHCLSDADDRAGHLRVAWRMLRSGGIFVFDNMAAPLERDMDQFRAWHAERQGQIHEDETGVTTLIDTTPPFVVQRPSEGDPVRFEVPNAMAMAHRFYSRLEHVVEQLRNLGFEILLADVRPPDPSQVSEMKFVHGDNVIYARKRLSTSN